MDTIITNPDNNDELSHAGVKGMRWGIRRYQNEDGSLTDLGKKRYSSAKRDIMDKSRADAYDKAVKKHLLLHPGDATGAKAAGRQASKDATATTKIDESKVREDTFKAATKSDLDNTNTILRETANASGATSNAVKNIRVNVKRLDLSKMTDTEMRQQIAREQLESQYDSMFNAKRHRIENGKQAVAGIIAGIGTAAVVAHSALEIALAVKKLKG